MSPVDDHITCEVFLEGKTTKESWSKPPNLITYFSSWQEICAHLVWAESYVVYVTFSRELCPINP